MRASVVVFAVSILFAAGSAGAFTGHGHEEDRQPAKQQPPQKPRHVTLIIGGDLGFGGSGQPVSARFGMRNDRRHAFDDLTRHIRPLLKGDLVFANLETVVTDDNTRAPVEKAYNFRMHPAGLAHLSGLGFNLLSTANNHSIDYGTAGMRDTLAHANRLRTSGELVAVHGLGISKADVRTPALFAQKGATFAFAALGIGGVRPKGSRPGQFSPRAPADFKRLVDRLGGAAVDYRILSTHYGIEREVRPRRRHIKKYRDQAVRRDGIDLVIGHHAHTAAGIQQVGGRLIFYGLGNLLHLGMQDMARFNRCRDFGLLAKLHLVSDEEDDGRLKAAAIELFALTDMHLASRPLGAHEGRRRIEVINFHAAGLDDAATQSAGVRFAYREDGSGLYCAPDAADSHPAVAALCRNVGPPPVLDNRERRAIAEACFGGTVRVARKRRKRRLSRKRSRRHVRRTRSRSIAQRNLRKQRIAARRAAQTRLARMAFRPEN